MEVGGWCWRQRVENDRVDMLLSHLMQLRKLDRSIRLGAVEADIFGGNCGWKFGENQMGIGCTGAFELHMRLCVTWLCG